MTVLEIWDRADQCRADYRDAVARATSARARDAHTARLWASIARLTAQQGRGWLRLLHLAQRVAMTQGDR